LFSTESDRPSFSFSFTHKHTENITFLISPISAVYKNRDMYN
jgi:hypothetical protein